MISNPLIVACDGNCCLSRREFTVSPKMALAALRRKGWYATPTLQFCPDHVKEITA